MMKIKGKLLAFALSFAMTCSLVSPYDLQAAGSSVKLAKKTIKLTITKTDEGTTYANARIKIKKDKSVKSVKITYKSKNAKIAKVSKKGKVTAVKKGNTSIKVKVSFKKNQKKYVKTLTQKIAVKEVNVSGTEVLPVASETPVVTEAPVVSEAPAVTEAPVATPTATPVYTPTICPTEPPAATPVSESTNAPEPTPTSTAAIVPTTKPAFAYKHDPKLYQKAMEDVIVDENAIYGFAPNPKSTRLSEYAKYDWSDAKVVADGRAQRIEYHESIESMYTMLSTMKANGKNTEEIARAISAERNRIRLASYDGDPEGLETVKKSNLLKYGNENGPTADSLYEKYGSWETVLEKAFSPNIGMDICLGLFDDYFDSYIALGILPNNNPGLFPIPTEAPTEAPTATPKGNITYAEYVSPEMTKADYWIAKSKDPDKELMTREDIDRLNAMIPDAANTSMNKIFTMSATYNGNSLKNSLGTQATPAKMGFIKCVPMPDKEAYYQQMRDNILAAETTEADTIKYAIAVKRANMKSWPTSDIVGNSLTDTDDELQLSALVVNEPVVAKTVTGDGKFTYVISTNCMGWVETESLAICKDKEEWMSAWNATGDDFLVVTTDKITLEESFIEDAVSKVELSLSTKLNLVPKEDIPRSVNERGTWNNYVVYLPTRDADGNYKTKMALIPQRYNVSVGYPAVTERNLLNISFECLGSRYGWGGMLGSMDCSMYTGLIYRCFGINLPRNTTGQPAIPTNNYTFSYETETYESGEKETYMIAKYGGDEVVRTPVNGAKHAKEEILDRLPAGTLLRFSGHIVMYIGKEKGRYYCINDLGSLYKEEGTEDSTAVMYQYSVVVNTLDVRRGGPATDGGRTWMSHFTDFICPWDVKK